MKPNIKAMASDVLTALGKELRSRGYAVEVRKAEIKEGFSEATPLSVNGTRVSMTFPEEGRAYYHPGSSTGRVTAHFDSINWGFHQCVVPRRTFKSTKSGKIHGLNIIKIADHVLKWVKVQDELQAELNEQQRTKEFQQKLVDEVMKVFPDQANRVGPGRYGHGLRIMDLDDGVTVEQAIAVLRVLATFPPPLVGEEDEE